MAGDFIALAAQAHAAYAAGDHSAAELLYTAALDAASSSAISKELLATLYANRAAARLRGDESSLTGMHDAGLALTLNPNLPRPRLRLATALAAAGREAEASEQATLVLGLHNLSVAMTREATAVLRQSAARIAASCAGDCISSSARVRAVAVWNISNRASLCSSGTTAGIVSTRTCNQW